MAEIFLSYASQDRSRAASVARELSSHGWTVFWDRDMLPGVDWESELERQLKRALCVVVLWSRHANESKWVQAEVRVALDRGVLVPVLLDTTDRPLRLRDLQAAFLAGTNLTARGDEMEKLVTAIAKLLGSTSPRRHAKQRGTASGLDEDLDFGSLGF